MAEGTYKAKSQKSWVAREPEQTLVGHDVQTPMGRSMLLWLQGEHYLAGEKDESPQFQRLFVIPESGVLHVPEWCRRCLRVDSGN